LHAWPPEVCLGGESKRLRLFVVGNPPFTNHGTADQTDRDQVLRFIRHSILTLGASRVAFIVPQRCSRARFLAQVSGMLSGDDPALQVIALRDSTFEVHGRKVRQPCAILLVDITPPPQPPAPVAEAS
jgi:hypothetical protein